MKKNTKSEFIDISVALDNGLPTWPGSHGVNISRLMGFEKGDPLTVSRFDIDVHSGTHIDAPLHFVKDGKTTTEIPLSKLIGTCQVVSLEGKKKIGRADLNKINLESGVKKLLLKTNNSKLWKNPTHEFCKEFTALTSDGAEWVVENELELIGIDYHSIQLFNDPFDTHIILLSNEVVILEGLNLSHVEEGCYDLFCLPIKVNNVEGIPARAILKMK